MRIINANTLEAKEELLGVIEHAGPVESKEWLDAWLKTNLGTEVFGAWLAVKDEPVGFIICEMLWEDTAKTFVPYLWVRDTKAYGPLLDKVEKWAKERNATEIKLFTNKSHRTLVDKYNYVMVRTALKKVV